MALTLRPTGTCARTRRSARTCAPCAARPSPARTTWPSELHSRRLFHPPRQRPLSNRGRDRHRRIHEQQQNGEAIDAFSDEELEADQDHLVSLEEESPESEHAFLTGAAGLMSGGGGPGSGGGHHSHHNSLSGVGMNM